MPRSLHLVLQALFIVAQFAPHIWGFLTTPAAQAAWPAMISALQAWLANAAHNSNPDGTSCLTAYRPGGKD